ncbi:MAG: hypothetical protein R2684_01730 [Pyrinomonadaceae bacterium]
MNRFFAVLVLLAVSAFVVEAQIKIVPTKVVYTRVGEGLSEFKQTFEVNYPVPIGDDKNGSFRTLSKTINYWDAFDMSLEESLGDYTWLERLDYQILYNNRDILTIELIQEGSGAYPDGSSVTYVVDLKTGKRIMADQVFTNMPALVKMIDKAQKAEIKQAIIDAKAENLDDADSLDQMFKEYDAKFTKVGQFIVDEKGVTFLYDYGFPHAVAALEPEGKYEFTWEQMKPYLKPGGLLTKFAS